ncbi:class II aldolase/adducin family protein [Paraburkholderia sediminicola]|uniref:class II aldolase/adducin family protein n=1 Tax=Paraburkholderia sediminicola TaxID=458836 RepID=UPI0038BB0976
METTIEPGVVPQRSDAEMKTRRDLSALYRLIAHFRMTDLIDTHISARVPGTDNHFLINHYGVMFHEMTPEDLVKIDIDGNPVEPGDEDSQRVNAAGFTIHSAIHSARHDLVCVIHTHTADGIAVACQQEGLLPITQHALRYYNRIGYHAYEGIALDLDERERLIRNLGTHHAMILRNHGLLAAGRTIAEAFINIHFLERACQAQVKAMSGGARLTFPSPEVCERTARQFERPGALEYCERAFAAAQRLL